MSSDLRQNQLLCLCNTGDVPSEVLSDKFGRKVCSVRFYNELKLCVYHGGVRKPFVNWPLGVDIFWYNGHLSMDITFASLKPSLM